MIRHIRVLLLFILILGDQYSSFAISRYFTWIDPKSCMRVRIDLDNYDLYRELGAGGWKNEGKINVNPADLKDLTPSINNEYFFYDQGKRIRLTLDGTGQVFDYMPASKKLTRIDRTIHSGFNFGAQKFIREGIVYSFGGTGFWSFSQALTYYDEKTAEWQILRPRDPGPSSIVNGYQGYSAKSDIFYSGGSEFYRFLENLDIEYSDEFYAFNFKTHEWDLLGDINKTLPYQKLREIIWTGAYFIHFANDKLFIINPESNQVYEYHDANQMLQGGYMNYSKGDTVYTFWHINDGPVVTFSVKEILAKSNYIGPFYSNNHSKWYFIGGITVFILGLGTWGLIKKIRSPKRTLFFNPAEVKLLKALMSQNPLSPLSTNEINDILELSDKSLENQRRIRMNIINQINQKIALFFELDKAIERIASEEDKRLILHKLNPEVSKYIKEYL